MAKITLMKAALKHVPTPNRVIEQKELKMDVAMITAVTENKKKLKM